jgi:hypothetical protein
MYPYKLETNLSLQKTAYMAARNKYHKTACTNLPEDEHLGIRNMSKTLYLKQKVTVKSVHFVGSYCIGISPFIKLQ